MFPSRSPLGDLDLLRRPFSKIGLLLVSFSGRKWSPSGPFFANFWSPENWEHCIRPRLRGEFMVTDIQGRFMDTDIKGCRVDIISISLTFSKYLLFSDNKYTKKQ